MTPASVRRPSALAMLIRLLGTSSISSTHWSFLPCSRRATRVRLAGRPTGATRGAREIREAETRRFERIVAERHIESHEEGAERFPVPAPSRPFAAPLVPPAERSAPRS